LLDFSLGQNVVATDFFPDSPLLAQLPNTDIGKTQDSRGLWNAQQFFACHYHASDYRRG
jgi:hypothetical protein